VIAVMLSEIPPEALREIRGGMRVTGQNSGLLMMVVSQLTALVTSLRGGGNDMWKFMPFFARMMGGSKGEQMASALEKAAPDPPKATPTATASKDKEGESKDA